MSKLKKKFVGLFRSNKKSVKEHKPEPELPADPFGERVDMDITFRNELHELLYVRIRKGNTRATEFIWNEFLRRNPEFEPLRDEWLASRQQGITPMNHGLPWMNYAAIDFLDSYLTKGAKVFEWGMGGSTVYWSTRAGEIISVEHDSEWFALAKNALEQLDGDATHPVLKLYEPQDKHDTDFRSGLSKYKDMSFENYTKAICEFPEAYFDLIVVDGRSRMACLKHCVPYLAPNGVILLDNSDYSRYQQELEAFWDKHKDKFKRTDFLSPTPFSSNIGSQTTIFAHTSN